MQKHETAEVGTRYMIVDGHGTGHEGECVEVRETTFGFNFARIKDDEGNIFSKRVTDIEPVDG